MIVELKNESLYLYVTARNVYHYLKMSYSRVCRHICTIGGFVQVLESLNKEYDISTFVLSVTHRLMQLCLKEGSALTTEEDSSDGGLSSKTEKEHILQSILSNLELNAKVASEVGR